MIAAEIMAMKTHYCILPSGNASEFPVLDDELRRRNVDATYAPLRNGGRIYAIPEKEVSKLPSDEKGPYLGDDVSGHGIYELPRRGWPFDEGLAWVGVLDRTAELGREFMGVDKD